MDRRRKVITMSMIVVIVMVMMIMGYQMGIFGQVQTKTYQNLEEVLYNPMMGFAVNADYPDAVGSNTLVYMDMTWREIEPKEGEYNFTQWEADNFLERWRQEGKQVVFRFVCDIPSAERHLDIPDWLYEQTRDGVFYDISYGQGYAPNYENEVLIKAHQKVIEAIGARYGQDDFFFYIELGSLGHWGEFHVKSDENLPPIPGEEICREYIEPYVREFPNAKLMMRRPYVLAADYQTGLYNDMTGEPVDTEEWLGWLEKGGSYEESVTPLVYEAMPDCSAEHPIGGEFTSSLSMNEMLTNRIDRTLSLLEKSHTTFIGPNCPVLEEITENQAGVDRVLKTIGYRYGIRKSKKTVHPFNQKISVTVWMDNQGVAPMYVKWPVCIYLTDTKGNIIEKQILDVDVTKLYGGDEARASVTFQTNPSNQSTGDLEDGYQIWVGIENTATGLPAVKLNMQTQEAGDRYRLY